MELRIQKELFKMAIEHEWLFTRSEKLLLKLTSELAQSTGELAFLSLLCYWNRQKRAWWYRKALSR